MICRGYIARLEGMIEAVVKVDYSVLAAGELVMAGRDDYVTGTRVDVTELVTWVESEDGRV